MQAGVDYQMRVALHSGTNGENEQTYNGQFGQDQQGLTEAQESITFALRLESDHPKDKELKLKDQQPASFIKKSSLKPSKDRDAGGLEEKKQQTVAFKVTNFSNEMH